MYQKRSDRLSALVIIGTGLFPEIAKLYFDKYTEHEVAAVACHRKYKSTEDLYGLPLVCIEDMFKDYPPSKFIVFVAVGYKNMNKVRESIYREIKTIGYEFASFIHPNVTLCETVSYGENTFVFEDNTLQPFTKIGNNTIIWSGNHVGHHSVIGDHCFISSHVVISGSCKVENNVFIGVNATLHDNISIASETFIGSSSLITKSTKEKSVYVTPGTKQFKKNSDKLRF